MTTGLLEAHQRPPLTACIYSDGPDGSGPVTTPERDAAILGVRAACKLLGGVTIKQAFFDQEHDPVEKGMPYVELGEKLFDPKVDLHVYLTDRDITDLGAGMIVDRAEQNVGESVIIGASGILTGLLIVNTKVKPDNLDRIRRTAMHETSHALGFLADGAENAIPGDEFHCSCEACVKYPTILEQNDFCSDCKVETVLLGGVNVDYLRERRKKLDIQLPGLNIESDDEMGKIYRELRKNSQQALAMLGLVDHE